ncbi:MAG: hypothetical protein GF388_04860 [Candidatus Aegiribacteria sp.]|nr:hypothetical protein [Candidatus Aegiribacteria sp.]MBD3294551.1 hypothetical protein [Candidatus Fermentibacteria bacterium]
MTDSAYSVLLFSGLVAGPASAFLVDFKVIPFYAVFPLLGLAAGYRKGMLKLFLLAAAPAFLLVWGLVTSGEELTEHSLRWIAAVVTGATFSGALGASRASQLLFSLSKKVRFGGLAESLAMVLSLAGPFSERVKAVFINSRKQGKNLTDSFTEALSSAGSMKLEHAASRRRKNGVAAAAAVLAWAVLLGGIMEVL